MVIFIILLLLEKKKDGILKCLLDQLLKEPLERILPEVMPAEEASMVIVKALKLGKRRIILLQL